MSETQKLDNEKNGAGGGHLKPFVIPEYDNLTTYAKGHRVMFIGKEYECTHDGLIATSPLSNGIRILIDTKVERNLFRTVITKEFENIKPWKEV